MELHPPACFASLIQQHAATGQTRGFFVIDQAEHIEQPKAISYHQLDRAASKLALHLKANQLTYTPILLSFPSGFDFVIGLLGCFYAGVPTVIMDYGHAITGPERTRAIIKDAKVGLILTSPGQNTMLSTKIPSLLLSTALNTAYQPLEHKHQHDETALIYYPYTQLANLQPTLLSYRQLFEKIHEFVHPFPNSTIYKGCCNWLPTNHSLGLWMGVLLPLLTGTNSWLIAPNFFEESPLIWLYILSQQEIGITVASSLAYERCLRTITREQLTTLDLSALDICLLGNEPLSHETLEQFNHTFFSTGFKANNHYPVYSNSLHPWPLTTKKLGTPNAKLHIARTALEHDKITLVAQHHPYEKVLVSCGNPFHENIIIAKNIPTEQCKPFDMGYIWVNINKHWSNSKDWGFTDNHGHLYCIANSDEVITVENRHIVASDIEYELYQQETYTREPAVVALANDKQQLIILQEIQRYEKRYNAIYKTISEAIRKRYQLHVATIYLVRAGTLPKNAAGSIDRLACAALLANDGLKILNQYEQQQALVNEPELPINLKAQFFREWLIKWLAERTEQLHIPINEQDHLTHYGVDSFTSISLSKAIEYTFGESISPADIWRYPSVEKLAAYFAACALPPPVL